MPNRLDLSQLPLDFHQIVNVLTQLSNLNFDRLVLINHFTSGTPPVFFLALGEALQHSVKVITLELIKHCVLLSRGCGILRQTVFHHTRLLQKLQVQSGFEEVSDAKHLFLICRFTEQSWRKKRCELTVFFVEDAIEELIDDSVLIKLHFHSAVLTID